MKQENRHLGFLKQYLKNAEEKEKPQEIEHWKVELDSRLKLTKEQIIQYWDETHQDIWLKLGFQPNPPTLIRGNNLNKVIPYW